MEEVVDSLKELVLSKKEMKSMFKTFTHLINTRNLNELKQSIDLLPEKNRNDFLYGFSIEKSLMFQACFSKATQIVEYFIERCAADVNEVIQLENESITALFIAIKTGNTDLVHLLINNGADINWRDTEHRSAIVYACHLNKMEVAYALKNHGANINDIINQNLCVKSLSYFKRALKLGADVNYIDGNGETILMKAAEDGELDVINLLLKEKANLYLRSYYSGRNALDIAYSFNKEDVLAYFKKNSVYSVADKVLSQDLCGALAVVMDHDIDKALNFWKTAARLRRKHSATLAIFAKEIPALQIFPDDDNGDFVAVTNRFNIALEVLSRIIESNHPFISRAFPLVAYNPNFFDLFKNFSTLKSFCKLNPTSRKPISNGFFVAMTGAISLCEKEILGNNDDAEKTVSFIVSMVNFITGDIFPILRQVQECLYTFKIYKQLLLMLLHLIDFILEVESSENHKLNESIEKIVKIYTPYYPTSMLLIAIERGFSFRTVLCLVACGADVNARDYIKNTPLHLIGEQPDHFPEKNKTRELLIDSGAKVDAFNNFGLTPCLSLLEI